MLRAVVLGQVDLLGDGSAVARARLNVDVPLTRLAQVFAADHALDRCLSAVREPSMAVVALPLDLLDPFDVDVLHAFTLSPP
jgi:hypothetical protein